VLTANTSPEPSIWRCGVPDKVCAAAEAIGQGSPTEVVNVRGRQGDQGHRGGTRPIGAPQRSTAAHGLATDHADGERRRDVGAVELEFLDCGAGHGGANAATATAATASNVLFICCP
jgi:hypothetical protein